MSRLIRLLDILTDRVTSLGAWLVVPLFAIMTYEVVARFAFDLPTFWAYELAYMITGAHFVLGIAYVLKMDRHIRIDFFYARLSPRRRALIDFVTYVAFLLPVAGWMTWRLVAVAAEAFRVGEVSGESAWNPVVWPLQSVVAFGFALFTLQIVAEAVRTFRVVFGRDTTPS